MGTGSGDRLARGAAKAQFTTTGGGITDAKWNEAFGDFDAEKYRNGNSNTPTSGVPSSDSGTVESNSGS